MATNPSNRRALIDQIPKEEGRSAPVAQPGQGIHSSEAGRQVYNTAMALPGVGGIGKVGGAGGLISKIIDSGAAATNAGSRFTGAMVTVPALLPAAAAADNPAARSADGAGAGRGHINSAAVNPSAPAPQAASLANSVTKSVDPSTGATSYSGREITDGFTMNGQPMGAMLGGGSVAPQNMAAADRLAGGNTLVNRAGIVEPGSMGQQQFRAPTVAHSGNDFTAREALRRSKMDASSLIHRSHWAPKGSGQAAQKAYGEALQADMSAMTQGQAGADIEAMRQNVGLQQEQIRQSGADRREGRRSLIDAARIGMEQETQGFANRAAGQQEQLRNTLLDPKATPQQRAIAQRSLIALSGKTAADRVQAVNLPDTITDTGAVVRGGQTLVRFMEDGAAQEVPVAGRAAAASGGGGKYAVGSVSKMNGKEAVWDGASWVSR